MRRFQYQSERKHLSEAIIINALDGEERSFTQLLKLTGLSKPVLSKHLKRMKRERKLRKIKEKNRRPRYRFIAGSPEHPYIKRILFSVLSTQLFDDLYEATGQQSLADEEYIRKFSEKIGCLALYLYCLGLYMAKGDPQEAGKWIEEAFGTLVQKYAWRRCTFRQILGGEYELKHPVLLRKPVAPEFEDSLVRLPEAFVPGVTGKILSQLRIDKDKLSSFRSSLERVSPQVMKKLNEITAMLGMEVN